MEFDNQTRRTFLRTAAASAATLGGLAAPALAQSFPSQPFNVVIGTSQGGGLERLARAFAGPYSERLGQPMEFDFNPGAGGQLAYELYVHRTDPTCYNLLFGNVSAEAMMYALQEPNYEVPEDVRYYCGVDSSEETVIWVAKDSEFQTIEDLVEAGKSRTVTVGNSRLNHPASLALLSLAEEVGIDVNVVPFGGGGPTVRSVLAGEVDAGTSPVGLVMPLGEEARILTIFSKGNKVVEQSNVAPPYVNDVFGTSLPSFPVMVGWAVHTSAKDTYPDRYQMLVDTARETAGSEGFRQAYERTGMGSGDALSYVDHDGVMAHFQDMVSMANRFRDIISG